MRTPLIALVPWFVLCSTACLPVLQDELPRSTAPAGRATGLSPRCSQTSASSAGARYGAFIDATNAFILTADALDTRLRTLCNELGTEIGMTGAELKAKGTSTLAVCSVVGDRVRTELVAARNARIQLRAEVEEPVCVTRVEEYRQCVERCDTRLVQAGQVSYTCEGGGLRGQCSGQCEGQCAAQSSAACSGACEGTCTGSCSGDCWGICDGECSARDAEGRCAGTCRGTCQGTCTAGCSGSCNGRCVVQAQASCQGECRGGCSVQLQQPHCEGRIVAPQVSVECREVCEPVQIAHRECTPGSAKLVVDATAAAAAAARVRNVLGAVEHALPKLHALAHLVRSLHDSGEGIVHAAGAMGASITELGANALLCAAQAAAELPRAVGQVGVSVQVTVSLTASIDGSISTR